MINARHLFSVGPTMHGVTAHGTDSAQKDTVAPALYQGNSDITMTTTAATVRIFDLAILKFTRQSV